MTKLEKFPEITEQKLPKDLGIKIGTEKEVFWTGVKDAAADQVDTAEKTIILQSKVIEMAEVEIQKEKDLNTSKKKG